MSTLLIALGLVLLVVGAESLVRGASRAAVALGISPLVVGLTVVALGTSSPELAVSLNSAFTGHPELTIGNVVGSNIANILLILGLTSLFVPLMVARRIVRLDVPLMIGFSAVLMLLADNGVIGRLEGIALMLVLAIYVVYTVWEGRREPSPGPEDLEPTVETPVRSSLLLNVGMMVAGLALLVLGSRLLVDGAREIALSLGMSELVIGLTVVAVGTSMPEIATSLLAALKGERDLAVGNVVGSNIFNILCVLAATAVLAPDPLRVPAAAVRFDLPVMLVVSLACLPVFFNGIIGRREGALFLAYYAAYIGYVVLQASEHDALDAFSTIMLLFVIPPTLLALFASFFWGARWRGVPVRGR